MVDDVTKMLCIRWIHSIVITISFGESGTEQDACCLGMMRLHELCGERSGRAFAVCPRDSNRCEIFGKFSHKLKIESRNRDSFVVVIDLLTCLEDFWSLFPSSRVDDGVSRLQRIDTHFGVSRQFTVPRTISYRMCIRVDTNDIGIPELDEELCQCTYARASRSDENDVGHSF